VSASPGVCECEEVSGERLLVGVPGQIHIPSSRTPIGARPVIIERNQMLRGHAKPVIGGVGEELAKMTTKEVALR